MQIFSLENFNQVGTGINFVGEEEQRENLLLINNFDDFIKVSKLSLLAKSQEYDIGSRRPEDLTIYGEPQRKIDVHREYKSFLGIRYGQKNVTEDGVILTPFHNLNSKGEVGTISSALRSVWINVVLVPRQTFWVSTFHDGMDVISHLGGIFFVF